MLTPDIRQHRQMNFLEAVRYTARLLPGVASDMKLNAELAKGQPKDMQGIGRLAVSIPDPVYLLMESYFPDLFQEDQQLQRAAWARWLHTSDAKPFRVGTRL